RAAEPGCMVLRAALHPRKHAGRPAARLLRARRRCLAGCRLFASASGATEIAGRRRLRQAQGFRAHQIGSSPALRIAIARRGRPTLGRSTRRSPPVSRIEINQMSLVEVKVPQLSESVAEATLLQWKKKVGDAIAIDEILIEVETDKVVLEVPAPSAGVLTEIVQGDGATVAAEQLIARIDTAATAGAS